MEKDRRGERGRETGDKQGGNGVRLLVLLKFGFVEERERERKNEEEQ